MMDPSFKQKIQNSFEKICTSWTEGKRKKSKPETSFDRKWTDHAGEIQMYFDFLDIRQQYSSICNNLYSARLQMSHKTNFVENK